MRCEDFEIIGEIECGSGDYSFDLFRVVQDAKSGNLFYATDSGCSCPSPFEDVEYPEDYTKITRGASFESFKTDFENYIKEHGNYVSVTDKMEFIKTVKDILKRFVVKYDVKNF